MGLKNDYHTVKFSINKNNYDSDNYHKTHNLTAHNITARVMVRMYSLVVEARETDGGSSVSIATVVFIVGLISSIKKHTLYIKNVII